jgi:hypothetical protein
MKVVTINSLNQISIFFTILELIISLNIIRTLRKFENLKKLNVLNF